jgi:phosphatidylserine/phosphatidylglycerophosphate/cardiolipin synthase-like enzyme
MFIKSVLGMIFLFSLAAQSQELLQSLLIEPRFTNPQCQSYEGKPRNAYCTRADVARAQTQNEGPYKKVLELIKKRGVQEITLGTMTFSHKDVAAALCQAISNRVQVTVLIDSSAEMVIADSVAKCGGRVFKVGTAEPEDEEAPRGDLHHNKFLLAKSQNESTLVFSTANFSNPGLTINHEVWTFVTAKNDSEFIQNHECLIESLKSYTDDLSRFRKDMLACRSRVSKDQSSPIESLFVPADSARLMKLIDDNIRSSSRVLLSSNRYSYDKVTSAIAASKSRDSRAVFDDDLYWGGVQPTEDYVREALDARKVAQLEKTGAKVRFTQTSYGAAQKMHSKFIVLDRMVIVGAGNYTYAGMSSNFENFYVIRDPVTVEKFKQQFEYLWSLSTPRSQMPKDYTDFGVR